MSSRRSPLLAVLAAAAMTVTACGSQRAGAEHTAAAPTRSYPPPPKCAQAAETPAPAPAPPSPGATGQQRDEGPGDQPPNYADNHAYRMQASLSPEREAAGLASAALIRKELEKVRKEGGAGEYGVYPDARIEAALRRLGCGPEHGVFVGYGSYAVYTGIACVSGRVTKDELTAEVHGVYVEPQPGEGPCVENRGGH